MFESGNDPVENRIAKQVRVVALLEEHFPDIDANLVAETAERLMTGYTAALWLHSQSAGNRAPSTDQEALRKATKHLEKAAAELANLNAAGNEALYHFAQEAVTKDLGLTSPYLLEGENAKTVLAGQIGSIAKRLVSVAATLEPTTKTPLERLGGLKPEAKKPGRPEKLAAAQIGREAMEVFRDFTGKYPSKTVNPYMRGNPASGKILEFLSALFEILEIHARPEAVFQQISKTKRQKEKKTQKRK